MAEVVTKEMLEERLAKLKRRESRLRTRFAEDVALSGAYHLHGDLHGLADVLSHIECVEDLLHEITEEEEREDTKPPTYHGIMRAECLTCFFVSDDRVELELWNDYGVACPKCNTDVGSTRWWLQDGTVKTTHQDQDGHITERIDKEADA
jgi:hypothetical protein